MAIRVNFALSEQNLTAVRQVIHQNISKKQNQNSLLTNSKQATLQAVYEILIPGYFIVFYALQ